MRVCCVQALFDLEATNQELKPHLRDLYITSAREIEIHGAARKAIVIHVRFAPALCQWQGAQTQQLTQPACSSHNGPS